MSHIILVFFVIFRSYLLGVRYSELQENTTLIITLSAEGENCAVQDSLSVNLTVNGRHSLHLCGSFLVIATAAHFKDFIAGN